MNADATRRRQRRCQRRRSRPASAHDRDRGSGRRHPAAAVERWWPVRRGSAARLSLVDLSESAAVAVPDAAGGLTEAEASQRLARAGRPARPVDEPVVREHRPRECPDGVQPDPRRVRGGDADLRGRARRPVPGDHRRQRDDRDQPGGAGEAGARSSLAPRRAARERQARRCGPHRRGRAGRGRRRGAGRAGRSGDRRRNRPHRRRPAARRVDPHRRI